MEYLIYLVTNKINNKVYVGLTSTSLKKRWSRHCKKAKYKCKNNNGNYFQRAIVKYGKNSWDFKILETCDSLEEAEVAETKWIAHFNSNQKEFGYNLTIGGNVSKAPLDPRVKAKISKSVTELHKNINYSNNIKKKIKKWYQNNTHPWKGKRHTQATKDKLSKISKKWHETNNNPFLGKSHTKDARNKMSKSAKRRCADPNWQPPLVRNGVSEETRKKMSEAAKKRERHSTICTKEELLELSKKCKTQKEIAQKLSCTAAAISYLIKSWNLKEDIRANLKLNQ